MITKKFNFNNINFGQPISGQDSLQRVMQSDTFEIFERLSRQCLADRYLW